MKGVRGGVQREIRKSFRQKQMMEEYHYEEAKTKRMTLALMKGGDYCVFGKRE
jgi:hypothetical protein